MSIEERRLRERAAQRQLILVTARALAEHEGWDVVTTRRLSAEIEYSQPIIYKHFASLDDLAEAVALEGFSELAVALADARRAAEPADGAVAVARAYTSYALRNPALYDAMFTRASPLQFGADDVATPLAAAYAELYGAVLPLAGERDVDTLAEVLWSALHGLILLARAGRLRPSQQAGRLELLVDQLIRP